MNIFIGDNKATVRISRLKNKPFDFLALLKFASFLPTYTSKVVYSALTVGIGGCAAHSSSIVELPVCILCL